MPPQTYPMCFVRDVSERFVALRRRAGLSQAEVARRTGLQRQLISRFESGRVLDISLWRLLLLLGALDLGLELVPLGPPPTLDDLLLERRAAGTSLKRT